MPSNNCMWRWREPWPRGRTLRGKARRRNREEPVPVPSRMTSEGGDARELGSGLGQSSLWQTLAMPSRANFLVALIVASLIAALAPAVVLRRSATYESQATLLIDQPFSLATAGDGGIVEKLSRLRLKYSGLADTSALLEPAATELDTSLGALRDGSRVLTPQNTLTLVVIGSSSDADTSRLWANAVAAALIRYVVDEHDRYAVPAANRFQLSLVNEAGPGTKVSPDARSARAASLLGGLVGLLLAYVALQLFTSRGRPEPNPNITG